MNTEVTGTGHTQNKTLGSWPECDLVIGGDTVSQIHAQLLLTRDGFINVLDAGSDHGTWLCRNGQWIRAMKVELGQNDRIRFGDVEVPVDDLLQVFGEEVRVKFRDSRMMRLPAALAEQLAATEPRAVFERPRRNPKTGNIEEDV
jgi:pSer/pThr/pTyr-binding forkhead associated (FHA) protein